MAARHCSTCGAKHPINARRCKECGAPFVVMEAWAAAMGRTPSRDEVRAMRRHAKFEQLESFGPERLESSARQSIVDDHVDVDQWVSAALRSAFSGPPREPVRRRGPLVTATVAPLDLPEVAPRGPDRTRVVLGVTALVVIAFVVILVVNGRGSDARPPSNGKTALVEKSGNQRTNDDVVAEVVHDYCSQGYKSVRVTITRTELHDATGKVVQPAGVEVVFHDC